MIQKNTFRIAFYSLGFLAISGGYLMTDLALEIQLLILIPLIIMLGLPHGALDVYIARHIGLWQNWKELVLFSVLYLLIAAGVILLWLLQPMVSLISFLLISAWHFGIDGDTRSSIERSMFGITLLCAPSFFHPEAVNYIFKMLTAQNSSILIWIQAKLASLAFLGYLTLIWINREQEPKLSQGVLIISIIIFAAFLPPLVFFGLYFCMLHSPPHLLKIMSVLNPAEKSSALWLSAIFTGFTVLIAGMLYMVALQQTSFEVAGLKLIFIGLAALTVPHMILIDGIALRRMKL